MFIVLSSMDIKEETCSRRSRFPRACPRTSWPWCRAASRPDTRRWRRPACSGRTRPGSSRALPGTRSRPRTSRWSSPACSSGEQVQMISQEKNNLEKISSKLWLRNVDPVGKVQRADPIRLVQVPGQYLYPGRQVQRADLLKLVQVRGKGYTCSLQGGTHEDGAGAGGLYL
jgi:hypothetical protein